MAPVEHRQAVPGVAAAEQLGVADFRARLVAELVAGRDSRERDVRAAAVRVGELALQLDRRIPVHREAAALAIEAEVLGSVARAGELGEPRDHDRLARDRKSTRLSSSHLVISYAVFCLKKKKKTIKLRYISRR